MPLAITLAFPMQTSPDQTTWKVEWSVNAMVQSHFTKPIGTTTFEIPTDSGAASPINHGDQVVVKVYAIDSVGNESVPSEYAFQAADTVPPPQPQPATVVSVREV